jgi:adenine-specific DNA-methyltransferase
LLELLGWINSKLVNFTFKARSTSSNVNGYEVDNLPLIRSKKNDAIKTLTSEILALKEKDLNADTSQLERKIDEIIYELFELDKDEIKIIENANA